MPSEAAHYPAGQVQARRAAMRRDSYLAPRYVLLIGAAAAFAVSAGALLLPAMAGDLNARAQLGALAASPAPPVSVAPPAASPATPPLTSQQLETVASYARSFQPDDVLVQVRPGVFAKRSNVAGVDVGGRKVYYDVTPHQSFGPLRTGQLAESEVQVLARLPAGDTLVLVYAPRPQP
jgi:hypothetical protein